jgi:hypothetical protein
LLTRKSIRRYVRAERKQSSEAERQCIGSSRVAKAGEGVWRLASGEVTN